MNCPTFKDQSEVDNDYIFYEMYVGFAPFFGLHDRPRKETRVCDMTERFMALD